MGSIQRTRQRLADAIVHDRRLTNVGKGCGAEGRSRRFADRIIACPADQQIAFLEGIGEDEGLAQLSSVHVSTILRSLRLSEPASRRPSRGR